MTPEEFTGWLLADGPEDAVERLKRAYTASDIMQVDLFEELMGILQEAVPGA